MNTPQLEIRTPATLIDSVRTLIKGSALIVVVFSVAARLITPKPAMADSFQVLHTFSKTDATGTNSDGANPLAALTPVNGMLYGTAGGGGVSGRGAVFSVSPDGSNYTNLYSFSSGDGKTPFCSLVSSGNTLFGTTLYGGTSSTGTVFKVNTDGSGFATLHSFTGGADGCLPRSGLILSGNTLYGTASGGGDFGGGVVYRLNTDGSGFSIVHSFTPTKYGSGLAWTNAEGANPYASLALSGNLLFGTTYGGGTAGNGAVFAVSTDGSHFKNLHSFTSDGVNPEAELLVVGNRLYGTTRGTPTSVFGVNVDGTGFQVLHSFDLDYIWSGLKLLHGRLYGTTAGTLFSLNTDGSDFSILHQFDALAGSPQTNVQGAFVSSTLVTDGINLYGTATDGGAYGNGTLFSFSLPPQLTVTPSGQNMALSWPTNFSGYVLQGTTSLSSPAWSTNFPSPIVVNGAYVVTTPLSTPQRFFRLSSSP